MKVLHFSTHNEACGIAKYQERFVDGMVASGRGIENIWFDVSPNVIRHLGPAEYEATFRRLAEQIKNVDLVHIQHEFSFFSRDEVARIVDAAHKSGRRVAITMHTSPLLVRALWRPRPQGLRPRYLVRYLRAWLQRPRVLRNVVKPLRRADLLIVHNDATRDGLKRLGVPAEKISQIVHPVHRATDSRPSDRIRRELQAGDDDVVLCTVGFLHRHKGIDSAVKALTFLPERFKLAIIGGVHPTGNESKFYDSLADLIRQLGLIERVTITGYVADDEELDALIRECDIALYPYAPTYYDQVSSGALNVALANGMTTVAYPTRTFRELAALTHAVTLTASPNYYEIARTVQSISVQHPSQAALEFATKYSYENVSEQLAAFYRGLAA